MVTRLRGAGLIWAPHAGHYVFDIDGIIKAASPFQAGVHLISSPNAMARTVGGDESLHERIAWLPTWSDARAWLDDHGVPRGRVVEALQSAIDDDLSDLEAIYGLILESLDKPEESA
ncbi:MAG: hypothetical protein GKS06_05150 [Acidobacteria bacterium]|nr:hypothetical protein [Acidobacteriota bacterium]